MLLEHPEHVWRVGWHEDPLALPPRELRGWNHRFDDPHREFGSLYCSEHPQTALREVLADLRPSMPALKELQELFGPGAEDDDVGTVTAVWRHEHALAECRIQPGDARLIDVEDAAVLSDMLERHPVVNAMSRVGMDTLDSIAVRSRERPVTQAIARELFEQGIDAVKFTSGIDAEACFVLFEGRATLDGTGVASSLSEDVDELVQVCEELGLNLQDS